jgi:hypothetical protein
VAFFYVWPLPASKAPPRRRRRSFALGCLSFLRFGSSSFMKQVKGWRHFRVANQSFQLLAAPFPSRLYRPRASLSVEPMSLARPGRVRGDERPGASPRVRTARLDETRQGTPAKNPIRSRPGFEPFRRTGASPSCLPASHQRLPMSLNLMVRRGRRRTTAFRWRIEARFIQRQVMMKTFRFYVKKMQAGVDPWLTRASPGHSANPAYRGPAGKPDRKAYELKAFARRHAFS